MNYYDGANSDLGTTLIHLFAELRCRALLALVLLHSAAVASPPAGAQNGMSVILVGTGSPALGTGRNAPATIVRVADRLLLFDAGDGTARAIGDAGLPLAGVEAVFISHFHSDHFGGLGEVIAMGWNTGRRRPLVVYGPEGVAEVTAGLADAYALNTRYRSAGVVESNDPELATAVPRSLPRLDAGQRRVIYDQDGLVVEATPAAHGHVEPAYAYRVAYRGRSLFLSGDSLADGSLLPAARGVDVLVFDTVDRVPLEKLAARLSSEGNDFRANRARSVVRYHADAADVGRFAARARPALLVPYHLIPAPADQAAEERLADRLGSECECEIVVGRDGLEILLEPESDGHRSPPVVVSRGSLP